MARPKTPTTFNILRQLPQKTTKGLFLLATTHGASYTLPNRNLIASQVRHLFWGLRISCPRPPNEFNHLQEFLSLNQKISAHAVGSLSLALARSSFPSLL